MRVAYADLQGVLARALTKIGFTPARADRCATLFAEASRDGVYSHGLNRFPRFVATIANGVVDIDAEPQRVAAWGAVERWDGRHGPGNLNAHSCMDRAVALSRN